jgi:dsDNA-specific endonuclease/ATPase MutS2
MHQIRITRTSDLDSILSFLKARYPLLSEAEIIKMALSNQYYQETDGNQRTSARQQDPTKRFTKEVWQKKFAAFEQLRDQVIPEDEEELDQAIDAAVREVRAETSKAYGKTSA